MYVRSITNISHFALIWQQKNMAAQACF